MVVAMYFVYGGGGFFVYGGGCGFCLMVVAIFFFFFLMVLARFLIRCGGWVCVNDGSWVFVLDFTLFVLF